MSAGLFEAIKDHKHGEEFLTYLHDNFGDESIAHFYDYDNYTDTEREWYTFRFARELGEKEISQLKLELKRERECVDFYADKYSWDTRIGGGDDYCEIKKDQSRVDFPETVHKEYLEKWGAPTRYIGGKLARETQAQRKVELE